MNSSRNVGAVVLVFALAVMVCGVKIDSDIDNEDWTELTAEQAVAGALHQGVGGRPVAVAVEQRADDAARQHARERLVMRLRAELGHHLVALDDRLGRHRRQGLLQAFKLGLCRREGLREALALGGVLGRGEQRRDLPGEAREDRTDHPQVVVPGPFGTGGQALVVRGLLADRERLGDMGRAAQEMVARRLGIDRMAARFVAAVGRPNMVKKDWIKPGAVIIDVGINRGEDGKLVGDVDFAAASKNAGAITPVPGGVGPMTIATLLENTLQAAELHGTR